MDRLGYIWASAGAGVVRFDPKTRKFITFPEIPHPYGIEIDNSDNVWSAQFTNSEYPTDGLIGKIDINTLKVSVYTPPTTTKLASLNKEAPFEPGNSVSHPKDAGTKRIAVDSKGIVYFGEWWGGQDGQHGQIGRFDPKTETFKEYALPDPAPTPYGIGVDHNDFVWAASTRRPGRLSNIRFRIRIMAYEKSCRMPRGGCGSPRLSTIRPATSFLPDNRTGLLGRRLSMDDQEA
jgi:virginiamycin B lyase